MLCIERHKKTLILMKRTPVKKPREKKKLRRLLSSPRRLGSSADRRSLFRSKWMRRTR